MSIANENKNLPAAAASPQRCEYIGIRQALELLAARQCGSFCTEKDKDGNERYKSVEDRCASCIARLALQGATAVATPQAETDSEVR